jgi:DNA polymerase III delta subunit
MVYLFIGQDSVSKDTALARLKKEILTEHTAHFNLDTVHGKDTTLQQLQELLLFMPSPGGRRMLVVRGIEELKPEAKEFLLAHVRKLAGQKPGEGTVLVLDAGRSQPKDQFIDGLKACCKTVYFREERRWTVFDLARTMEAGKAAESLRILHCLLGEGEKPERLLGGLRATWQKNVAAPAELQRRMKLLLASDLDIKTGKAKPNLVLERLVIGLCGFRKLA